MMLESFLLFTSTAPDITADHWYLATTIPKINLRGAADKRKVHFFNLRDIPAVSIRDLPTLNGYLRFR
jgi:hypothetical protein